MGPLSRLLIACETFRETRILKKGGLPPPLLRYLHGFPEEKEPARPLSDLRFVVLDIETTGMRAKRDRILSLSAVALRDRAIVIEDSFEALFYNNGKGGKKSIPLHGILPSESLRGESEESILPRFLEFAKNDILVAHNANFDRGFLHRAMLRSFGVGLKNRFLDTARLAMHLEGVPIDAPLPHRGLYSLENLCLRYRIPQEEAHTSYGDALTASLLLLRLLRVAKAQGIETERDLTRLRLL